MNLATAIPKRQLKEVEGYKLVDNQYVHEADSQIKDAMAEGIEIASRLPAGVSEQIYGDSAILRDNVLPGLHVLQPLERRIRMAIIACDHFSTNVKMSNFIEEILFTLALSIPKKGQSYDEILFGFTSCKKENAENLAIDLTDEAIEYIDTYNVNDAPPVISARNFYRPIVVDVGNSETYQAKWDVKDTEKSDTNLKETWGLIRESLLSELEKIRIRLTSPFSKPSPYFEIICCISMCMFTAQWRNAAQVQQALCGSQCEYIMKYVVPSVSPICIPKPSKDFIYQFVITRYQNTRYGKRLLTYTYFAMKFVEESFIKTDIAYNRFFVGLLNATLLIRAMHQGMPLVKLILTYAKKVSFSPLQFFETCYWEMFEKTIDRIASDMNFLQRSYRLQGLLDLYEIPWGNNLALEQFRKESTVLQAPYGYYFARVFDDSVMGQFRADANPMMYVFLVFSYVMTTGDKQLLEANAVKRFIDIYGNAVITHAQKHSTYLMGQATYKFDDKKRNAITARMTKINSIAADETLTMKSYLEKLKDSGPQVRSMRAKSRVRIRRIEDAAAERIRIADTLNEEALKKISAKKALVEPASESVVSESDDESVEDSDDDKSFTSDDELTKDDLI